jgi:hypothetical protein
LRWAIADTAPAEDDGGTVQRLGVEELAGDEIGEGLGDVEFGLGENGAIATRVFEDEGAGGGSGGRAGTEIGRPGGRGP